MSFVFANGGVGSFPGGPSLTANNVFTAAPQQITIDTASDKGLIIKGAASQAGHALSITTSADAEIFYVSHVNSAEGVVSARIVGAANYLDLDGTSGHVSSSGNLGFSCGGNTMTLGLTTDGIKISQSGGSVGFYGTTPIAKQTGVAVTAGGIHAALVALGLIAA